MNTVNVSFKGRIPSKDTKIVNLLQEAGGLTKNSLAA